MHRDETTPRRGFLARVSAAAAGAWLLPRTASAAAVQGGPSDWIKDVRGTHRCLFDFPRHNNG